MESLTSQLIRVVLFRSVYSLDTKERIDEYDEHEEKVSTLAFPNSNFARSLHSERARWNIVRHKNAPMRHPRRVTSSLDLRKIITQIKTARNVARVALDHQSHNFRPKSRPVESMNSRRPRGIPWFARNLFLIRDEKLCDFSTNHFSNNLHNYFSNI